MQVKYEIIMRVTNKMRLTRSLPGATTHTGYWPNQEVASNHLYLGLALPISDSQPLCIPHHSIHPSKVWSSHSPSALRLLQGSYMVDYLSFILYILPI
jgi:hypothetical protein